MHGGTCPFPILNGKEKSTERPKKMIVDKREREREREIEEKKKDRERGQNGVKRVLESQSLHVIDGLVSLTYSTCSNASVPPHVCKAPLDG